MKQYDLKVDIRQGGSKNQSVKLRKEAMIPAILYGGREGQNTLLKLDEKEVNTLFAKSGEHIAVKLMLEDKEVTAIVKEVQRDPVHRNVIHIDFQPVSLHEIIHAEIPIVVINGERIEKNGLVINRQISELSVEGEVEKIPPRITVDVSKLKAGDTIKVSDVEISSELALDNKLDDIILSIRSAKDEPLALDIDREEPEVIDQKG